MKRYNDFIFNVLEKKAALNPDEAAIFEGKVTSTYSGFFQKVNQYASFFIENEIRKGDTIGILMNRNLNMLVSVFAVLRVGSIYLPISCANPQERIDFILNDSNAKALITDKEYKGSFSGKIIYIDSIIGNNRREMLNYPQVSGEDIAYIMYTSGSTGNPKGVLIQYKSLYNRIIWQQTKYPIQYSDVVLQKTVCSFDVSIWELLWWAIAGAKISLLPSNKENSPKAIINCILDSGVTAIHFVPSVFHLFVDYLEVHDCKKCVETLRYCFLSGEQANRDDVHRFYQLGLNTKLINLYGPTETTIDVSYFDCINYMKYEKVPIGKAISNTELMVINKDGRIARTGETGELCVAGIQLAHSYLNQDELTKEKFIYSKGKRIYKTGDLAKILSDGNYEYCGRLDRQIKLNGMRIDLMEIEMQLIKLEYILNAVVVLVKKQFLVAYYTAKKEAAQERIRKYLKTVLPNYMIPVRYIYCENIILKDNGKIDYEKLPDCGL